MLGQLLDDQWMPVDGSLFFKLPLPSQKGIVQAEFFSPFDLVWEILLGCKWLSIWVPFPKNKINNDLKPEGC